MRGGLTSVVAIIALYAFLAFTRAGLSGMHLLNWVLLVMDSAGA